MTGPGPVAWRTGRHATAVLPACPPRRGRRPRSGHGPGFRGRCAGAGLARAGVAVLDLIAAAPAVAACAASAPAAHLPPKPSAQATTPAPTPTASTPPRQAALAAYRAFWTAGARAERSGNPRQAAAILAPYTTPAWRKVMIAGMRPVWRRHQVAWGHNTEHILHLAIATGPAGPQTAIITDCQDASHSGLAHHGKLLRSTLGPRHARLYASLGLTGGHWRVAHITFAGNNCTG